MRHISKKLFAAILVMIIVISSTYTKPVYAVTLPSLVKIGLYFNYSNSIKTAVSSFTVSAEKGVVAGWYTNGGLSVISSTSDNSVLKIVKDSKYYFVYSAGITTKDQAVAKAAEITSKGITAFIAVNNTGSWVVLLGGYADSATANADKAANIDKKVPGLALTLAEPSAKRVIIENAAGQPVGGIYHESSDLYIGAGDANEIKVVKVNTKTYRGEIEVIRQQSSDMTVVNVVGLEQYLYGVVPAEIGGSTPIEAQKAQAVAARNYTINNLNKYASIGFNLCNTTYSQVYGGFSAETSTVNKSVDATAGQLVMYNDKPAQTFYFSSDGGMTEDVKNVWGSVFPYLVSVDDKYESLAISNVSWTKTLTADQIKARVSKDIGDVTGMEVTKRSAAGRATELIIKGTKDQAVYTNEGTRNILGLQSQWFTIQSDSSVNVGESGSSVSKQTSSLKIITASGLVDAPSGGLNVIGGDGTVKNYTNSTGTYTINGKGNGHAIGMSQYGAMGMARAGFTYKEILQHYFTGTVVQ